MSSLPLYPIKYLSEPLLQYDYFLETTIILIPMSSILNSFLFL